MFKSAQCKTSAYQHDWNAVTLETKKIKFSILNTNSIREQTTKISKTMKDSNKIKVAAYLHFLWQEKLSTIKRSASVSGED